MKTFFTFVFDKTYHNGDEDQSKNEFWSFAIEGDEKILIAIDQDDDEEYDTHFWSMEEYGVHDFMGCGQPGDDDVWTMGYHTYEVEAKNIETVMNGWRDHFVSRGFKCSDFTTIIGETSTDDGLKALGVDTGSDGDIYVMSEEEFALKIKLEERANLDI